MRKKSHISLAKLLLANMKVQGLQNHRKAFYIGSILPDIKPSFLTKRHTIDETFEILIEEIKRITVDYDVNKGINGYYARHLGVITHYLADYCTYPHNSIFTGTMTEHVYYEKELKFRLKDYVGLDEAKRDREQMEDNISYSLEGIIQFITATHKEYVKVAKAVKVDIQYIIQLCHKVVDTILRFLETATHVRLNSGYRNTYKIEYLHI